MNVYYAVVNRPDGTEFLPITVCESMNDAVHHFKQVIRPGNTLVEVCKQGIDLVIEESSGTINWKKPEIEGTEW